MNDDPIYNVGEVRHIESGACISNFGKSALGTDAEQALWDLLYRKCARGTLECTSDGHAYPDARLAYLQYRDGRHFAAHVENSQGHLWPQMTPGQVRDHDRLEQLIYNIGVDDYGQKAVDLQEDIGGDPGKPKRRPDVIIHGSGAKIGFEVQISGITKDQAAQRTADAKKSDITSLWVAPKQDDPPYAYHVPYVRTNILPPGVLQRGSLTVTGGLRRVIPRRCEVDNASYLPNGCPKGRRNWCGRLHPTLEPLINLVIDDVIEKAPRGLLVPLKHRHYTYLVSPEDRDVAMEMRDGAEPEASRESSDRTVLPHGDQLTRSSERPPCHKCTFGDNGWCHKEMTFCKDYWRAYGAPCSTRRAVA